MIQSLFHDPDSTLDYSFDWSDWLIDADTISTSDWSVESGTATLTNPTIDSAGAVTTVFVSAAAPQSVVLRNRITTLAGRTDDRSMRLVVTER